MTKPCRYSDYLRRHTCQPILLVSLLGPLLWLTVGTWSCSVDNLREFVGADSPTGTGTVPDPDTGTYRLRAGGDSNCYLYDDNDSHCWGRFSYTNLRTSEPKEIEIGSGFLCFLDQNDRINCLNEAADASMEGVLTAIDSQQASQLVVGDAYACIINTNSQVECWGSNTITTIPSPTNSANISLIAGGYKHVCITDDSNKIRCWGDDSSGQSSPPSLDSSKEYQAISAGEDHTCGIDLNANLRCWGAFIVDRTVTSKNFVAVSSGRNHVCGLDDNSDVHCFGDDSEGQLTLPSINYNYDALATGQFHTCGLTSTRKTACWGKNDNTQLDAGSLP